MNNNTLQDNAAMALCALDYPTLSEYQEELGYPTKEQALMHLRVARQLLNQFILLGFSPEQLRDLVIS